MPAIDVQDATRTHFCKFPSCTNEASSPVGRYSYCKEHQGTSAAAARTTASSNGSSGSVAARSQSLAALAREVDRAKDKVVKAEAAVIEARNVATAKEREFQKQARQVIGGDTDPFED